MVPNKTTYALKPFGPAITILVLYLEDMPTTYKNIYAQGYPLLHHVNMQNTGNNLSAIYKKVVE